MATYKVVIRPGLAYVSSIWSLLASSSGKIGLREWVDNNEVGL